MKIFESKKSPVIIVILILHFTLVTGNNFKNEIINHSRILDTINEDKFWDFIDEINEDETTPIEDEVFLIVEKMPVFPGGNEAFKNFILSNVKIPEDLYWKFNHEKIFIEYIVNREGFILDAKAVRGVENLVDKIIVEQFLKSPKWTPGEQFGQKVNVRFTIPIPISSFSVYKNSDKIKTEQSENIQRKIERITPDLHTIKEYDSYGDTLIQGFLSSVNPEIKTGKYIFYNKKGYIEAKGEYKDNLPVKNWFYFDSLGNVVKTINYSKTLLEIYSDTSIIDEPLILSEVMPKFNNKDYREFSNYLMRNLHYPIYPKIKGISDQVFVSFVIDENGETKNVKVVKSSGNLDFNLEVLRLIYDSPIWIPGMQGGNKVPVQFTFPIKFKRD